ncbi:MAG: 2-oxoacid:acceptor oxidoreductase family protein [Desulfohalobiaceae bacterium]|nr:2-oxoacid:acceptor oxidoreductase family protein [Desulfohalobiaceae bacterium]
MLIGNLLAYAAMDQGLECTFMPVYGVEMRGGTANCTVVLSDEEIGSPIVYSPKSLIVMNQPSVDKFQPRLAIGGVLVANTSIIDPGILEQKRLRTFSVPANSIADKLGTAKMANMVMLGAWLEATGCLALESAQGALDRVFSKQNSRLIPLNEKALKQGAEYVRGV